MHLTGDVMKRGLKCAKETVISMGIVPGSFKECSHHPMEHDDRTLS